MPRSPGRFLAINAFYIVVWFSNYKSLLYAKQSKDSVDKIEATPKARAFCPLCEQTVIAKCGNIKINHWAHESLEDCDNWSEGETDWHKGWKRLVARQQCEVVIGQHRADIVRKNGQVIELQHSHLNIEEIEERQNFYKNMIWVLDMTDKTYCIDKRHRYYDISFRSQDYGHSFYWKHPKRSYEYANNIVFDLGRGQLFVVKKIYFDVKCGGYGYFLSRDEFLGDDLLIPTISAFFQLA